MFIELHTQFGSQSTNAHVTLTKNNITTSTLLRHSPTHLWLLQQATGMHYTQLIRVSSLWF